MVCRSIIMRFLKAADTTVTVFLIYFVTISSVFISQEHTLTSRKFGSHWFADQNGI